MGVTSTSQTAEIEAALDRVHKSPGFAGVDFLLSNQWPRSILTQLGDSTGPLEVSILDYDKFGSDLVRKAAVDLAPRYHFATTPSHIHYERPPFIARLNSKTILHVTRFISLAEAFNTKKAKVRTPARLHRVFLLLPLFFFSNIFGILFCSLCMLSPHSLSRRCHWRS